MLSIILNIFYWIFLGAAVFVIPFSLPGPMIIVVINFIYQLLDQVPGVDWRFIAILLILGGLSELLEYIITAFSSRRSGASRKAMFGAVIGSIMGAIIGTGILPLIGSLIGALLGAFVGGFFVEYLEHRNSRNALKVGLGAFSGVAGGKITKIVLAIIMLVIIGMNPI